MVNLAAQGLSYGLHVVLGATRWAEIRPAMKDLLGTRFELRLGDPRNRNRPAGGGERAGRAGRGGGCPGEVALPGCAAQDRRGPSDPEDVGAGVQEAVAKVTGVAGPSAPRVRLLPERFPYEQLPAQERGGSGTGLIPIGVNENELAPVYLDFDADPHFLASPTGSPVRRTCCARSPRASSIATPRSRRGSCWSITGARCSGFITTDHLMS